MSARDHVQKLARSSYDKGDPIGWFDEVYRVADGNADDVPWSAQQPQVQHLTSWLLRNCSDQEENDRGTALVVACGLGDDADALALARFDVTAFDISPTAIDWAKKRFPNSTVQYCVADLFDPPETWSNSFDFVFETQTLQALPWDLRTKAFQKITNFLAPGGTLLVVTFGRDPEEDAGQLPWPLTRDELNAFTTAGLQEVGFEDVRPTEGRRQFVVEYQKPAGGES